MLSSSLFFKTVFIILGVGADDIFVYFDAWKQSSLAGKEVNKTMAHRVTW